MRPPARGDHPARYAEKPGKGVRRNLAQATPRDQESLGHDVLGLVRFHASQSERKDPAPVAPKETLELLSCRRQVGLPVAVPQV
jgi:hypothetical protein